MLLLDLVAFLKGKRVKFCGSFIDDSQASIVHNRCRPPQTLYLVDAFNNIEVTLFGQAAKLIEATAIGVILSLCDKLNILTV